ncbi:aerotaxis receptor [Pseudomonas duriflava]|uniref:Aerotaxis receptor n=1 Tax=Pseudomonas duriflava TaxID=459528 RepID=A0A562Q703_9PSED|nr:aerotaxis receptor [Pseudomonas duriflava]
MATASEEQSIVAEDIAQQINKVAETVETSAGHADITVNRGQELEKVAQDLRVLVERFSFNR